MRSPSKDNSTILLKLTRGEEWCTQVVNSDVQGAEDRQPRHIGRASPSLVAGMVRMRSHVIEVLNNRQDSQ